MSDGTELEQFAESFADHGGLGRVEEGELLDVAKAEVEHREDHAREGGTQDFGRRVGVAGVEILFGVETDAGAGAETSAASGALSGGGLRDGFDLETLHLRAVDIARDAREAGVDHGADAGNGDAGLGHVRGEDDAAALGKSKGALLLAGGKGGEKGDDVVLAVPHAREVVGRLADVAFAGEKHEDVVGRGQFGDGGGNVAREVECLAVLGGTVAELDGVEASGHGNHWGTAEERGEARGVERGGRDDHLQVAAAGEDALEDTEEEVDVEGTFVGLVHDDAVVGAQERVGARFGEQDAVRHELDARILRDVSGEAVLVADKSAHGRLELACDALGHRDGGEASRLGAGDAASLRGEAELQGHLRELGGLAAAGVAAHDDDRVRAKRREDFLAVCADRQFVWIVQVVHGVKYSKN